MVKKGDELPEEPEDEKPILHVGGAQAIFTENVPKQIQYTALGHLHRMHCVDEKPCPVYYGGSPLSYSFSEANQKKYVLIVDAEPGEPAKVSEVELKQGKRLLRKRAKGLEEALQWLAENQDALVELTLVTETFLTAMERRQLNAVHSGIVAIIPEVTDAGSLVGGQQKQIDLNQSMEELFRDYFKHEKGQEPNEDLMNLFKEVLAEEE
jgi:exonuclease SbcD